MQNDNKIRIFNLLSQLKKDAKLIVDKQKVDLSNLQNGICFLQVFNNEKLIGTTKIVKQ